VTRIKRELSAVEAAVLTALFAALAAAGGYLLIAVPNVELFTFGLYIAGYALGVARGFSVALIASLLYFGFNPQGGLYPPLLTAQICGSLAAPLTGRLRWRINIPARGLRIYDAVAALLVTLWFDLLTNLAYPLTAGFDSAGVIATLLAGIPFAMLHTSSNLLIFIFMTTPALALLARRNLV